MMKNSRIVLLDVGGTFVKSSLGIAGKGVRLARVEKDFSTFCFDIQAQPVLCNELIIERMVFHQYAQKHAVSFPL